MKRYRVFLGTPAYKWSDDPRDKIYHSTLPHRRSLQDAMAHPGLDVEHSIVIGDAHIERARACVLKNYLMLSKNKPFDFFLNIDSDIEFRAFDVHRACERMEQFRVDILGGPYAFKSEADGKKEGIVFRPDVGAEADEHHMMPCRYVGGGFTMVTAPFLQRMMDSFPELRFNLNPDLDKDMAETWALWNPIILPRPDWGENKGELLSEDYSFCHRGLEIGGRVMIDMTIALTHWDGKKPYRLPMKTEEEVENERRGVRDVAGEPADTGGDALPGGAAQD